MKTLRRTTLIAAVVATLIAAISRNLSLWPTAFLLVLWPALGGHFVELFYLNILRPKLIANLQIPGRIAVWFCGGALLSLGMHLTSPRFTLAWRAAGFGFIGVELLVHLTLELRGQASFYNGRG